MCQQLWRKNRKRKQVGINKAHSSIRLVSVNMWFLYFFNWKWGRPIFTNSYERCITCKLFQIINLSKFQVQLAFDSIIITLTWSKMWYYFYLKTVTEGSKSFKISMVACMEMGFCNSCFSGEFLNPISLLFQSSEVIISSIVMK
mgnify:FL=1